MSTKAIRVLIERCVGEWPRDEVDAARAEVEAIERAARAIEAWQSAPVATHEDKQRLSKDASAAFDVLSSIAKDVP